MVGLLKIELHLEMTNLHDLCHRRGLFWEALGQCFFQIDQIGIDGLAHREIPPPLRQKHVQQAIVPGQGGVIPEGLRLLTCRLPNLQLTHVASLAV